MVHGASRRGTLPVAAALLLVLLACGGLALASDTPAPQSVTVAGDLQNELGCSNDWDPACTATRLALNPETGIWSQTFALPAGSWQYKAALNGNWTENYGRHAVRGGDNIPLTLAEAKPVKFYYDHETHWITDNVNSVIASAPGSYQHFLGCPGDWAPDCLRSWLEDPDGDGIYTFTTRLIPAGDYEVKVAINESWSENYGQGGTPGGANIPFSVPATGTLMLFRYDAATHLLTVAPAPADAGQPHSVTIAGSLQSELGCPGDWQPDCATTHLGFDAADGVWQGTFNVPAGGFEYKAALNDSWDENYGLNATRGGANIPLNLAATGDVKFYYDHRTHWITSNANSIIATVPGSFQGELGCPGDWQPDCLRSWLEDPDGDGLYGFSTKDLPAGDYECKVAIREGWDENYGAGGVPNGPNIAFNVPKNGALMTFTYDPATHVLGISAEGGPRGNLGKARAHWVTRDTLLWDASGPAGTQYALHYDADGSLANGDDGVTGGTAIPLTLDPAGPSAAVKAKFPHLAAYVALKLPADQLVHVPEILKGQLAVSAKTADGKPLDATSIQIPGVLDDLFTYGGDLGVSWSGNVPTLRVWAPTARSVKLLVYADSNPATAPDEVAMTVDPATGVWSATGDASWKNRFYLYAVDVFYRRTKKVETNLVTDPYSLSLSTNGTRSQILDLNDPALKPAGWDLMVKPPLARLADITLYELHIRDFSANDKTVPAALRGTFRAFNTPGNGTKHLLRLSLAGLTHVHLLPAFDIASVDEDKGTWLETPDLTGLPADSDAQQAAVAAIQDKDGFNWGYDPFHFMAPEGSYATDPDGGARVREFREMVLGLSRLGLRTVMDSVFNHTSESGLNPKSVFDKIVPEYYHRLNLDGNIETSTCCENTASEHAMMGKLMLDALKLWATQYKVDGFRFDIMGHHMKSNIVDAQNMLRALTPEHDGVDGSRIYLYGEGWNFGETADGARGVNANQANMAGTGVGTFNDRIRDGARGGGPFSGVQEQGFITGLYTDPNGTGQGSPDDQRAKLLLEADWIRTGLAGALKDYSFTDRNGNVVTGAGVDYNGQPAGYTLTPLDVINYVSAHDNETLFDAVQLKAPATATIADRVRMNNLGISLVGLSQGIPFFHAGDELLRSKDMDRDSYNSGDWFNRLDFSYRSSNWGTGLPIAGKNQGNWGIMQPLLANPDLAPRAGDIARSLEHMGETLLVRRSSHLFRLGDADAVQAKLRFHNTGPAQIPGLIVMSLSDGTGDAWGSCKPEPPARGHAGAPVAGRATLVPGRNLLTRSPGMQIQPLRPLLPDYGFAVVLFNAGKDPVTFGGDEFKGRKMYLHPVQASSSDRVLRSASYDDTAGTFTVPGRTTAVFVCGPGPRRFEWKGFN